MRGKKRLGNFDGDGVRNRDSYKVEGNHNHLGYVVHADKLWFLSFAWLSGRFWMIGELRIQKGFPELSGRRFCEWVMSGFTTSMNFCVDGCVDAEKKDAVKKLIGDGWMDVIVVNRETMGVLRYGSLEMGADEFVIEMPLPLPPKSFKGFPVFLRVVERDSPITKHNHMRVR